MTRNARVLVTGFGPFPGVPNNISSGIADTCAKSWSAREGITAASLTLATEWHTAPAFARAHIERTQPDIVIHLGVSAEATNLTLETLAYNECDLQPDVSGHAPGRTALCPGGSPFRTTPAPVDIIAERLKANGQKVAISDNPGRYLCNAVYYETLSLFAELGRGKRCIFVHIPTELTAETVTRASTLQALDILLDTTLRC